MCIRDRATVIVIENSERFGLAQLHQLRGRVGRSDKQSYCYLICYSDSENAVNRMNAMVTMSDGLSLIHICIFIALLKGCTIYR